MKNLAFTMIVALVALVIGVGQPAADPNTRVHGHFAEVHGLHMYYEVWVQPHGRRHSQLLRQLGVSQADFYGYSIRPEHALELFRLVGGGVPGDIEGLPNSELAVLPATTHLTVADADHAGTLLKIIPAFLDRPSAPAG